MQGDVAVEVQIDSMIEQQSELAIQDVTELYQEEEEIKQELNEKENDPEMNFGEKMVEINNSENSPCFIEDSFENPTHDPPALEGSVVYFSFVIIDYFIECF